jgi:hypothetical protein
MARRWVNVHWASAYRWMPWDKESQCWHDKFAGDVVVPVSAYPPR